MKIKVCLMMIALELGMIVHAQLYIKPYVGYSLGLSPYKVISDQTINGVRNVYVNNIRFGQGANVGLAFGYQISNSLGVEINANTQVFNRLNMNVPLKDVDLSTVGSYSRTGFFGSLYYKHNIFQLSPQLQYSFDLNKFRIYIKAGPDFMFLNSVYDTYVSDYRLSLTDFNLIRYSEYMKTKNTGTLAIGVQNSLGVEYPLFGRCSLTAEITSVQSGFRYKKRELLAFSVNGEDRLNTVEDPIHIFSESDVDAKQNFSHLGVNIGLKCRF